MKKISISILLFFAIFNIANAQQMGITLFAAPTVNIVKYNDFNTFAEGYNKVNNSDLSLPKMGVGFSTGAEFYYDFFYFAFYYNKLNLSTKPIVLSDFSERNIDLGMKSYISNIGFNFGKGPFSVSPFAICGINDVDLDAYVNYFGDYKTYGNYKLDGVYSGRNMLFGFGLKANFFYKMAFASLGFSKTYSVFPTASIHDFGEKGDPVFGGGYTDIGTDWATYSSGNSWEYTGKYMSSANKQFIIQLTVGLFIGEAND